MRVREVRKIFRAIIHTRFVPPNPTEGLDRIDKTFYYELPDFKDLMQKIIDAHSTGDGVSGKLRKAEIWSS